MSHTYHFLKSTFTAITLTLISTNTSYGFTIVPKDNGSPPVSKKIEDRTFTVSLDPKPATYLDPGATEDFIKLLNTEFDGRNADGTKNPAIDWTFNPGAALEGTVTIAQYDPFITNTNDGEIGGAIVDLSFNGEGKPTNLRWIQFVNTDDPRVNQLNPTVDPPNTDRKNVGDDDFPFYFTEDETKNGFKWTNPLYKNPGNPKRTIQNPSENIDLVFLDAANRLLTSAPVDWDAYLYLTSWDGNIGGTVNIHDGIHWGFTITGNGDGGGGGGADKIPEPSSVLGVLALGTLGAASALKRKQNQKSEEN